MTEKTFKDKQREQRMPLQYTVYKGVTGKFGAIRLSLKKAYADERRDKDVGCVFVESAAAVGANDYDWENGKIIMALNVTDISKIILYLRQPTNPTFKKDEGKLKLLHDKGAGTPNKGIDITTLEINKPEDKDGFWFQMMKKSQGNTVKSSLPISQDEALAIATLLQAAIPLILAWDPSCPVTKE